LLFEGLQKKLKKSEEIKGPNISLHQKKLRGFFKIKKIDKKDYLKKKLKRRILFFKTKKKN
jgi:hypothetical protein